jgi:hypothetical protein
MTAADAVNLHIVRPAHDLQQDPVTRRLVVWQVRAAKVDAAGGTATKYDARYCSLAHSHFLRNLLMNDTALLCSLKHEQ